MKDRYGNIAVDDSRIKKVWKEYFKKLLNEEFEWNKAGASLQFWKWGGTRGGTSCKGVAQHVLT